MKKLSCFSVLLFLALQVTAQYTTVTNLSGTVTYGATNVTVVGAGSALSTPWCGVSPYWIGSGGPGSYTYNFSPAVKAVRVYVTAMDVGYGTLDTEKVSIFINGVFYPLTFANISTYAGTCGQPTEPAVGGQMVCWYDLGSGGGGQIDISECGIYSCEVWTNGVLNGNCQTFQFSTVGSCYQAVATSPCVGDTLYLSAVGDSTGATYHWSGPGAFSSTLQDLFIYPSAMADTGTYIAVRTVGAVTDTSRVHVTIHPLPTLVVSNNSPLCAGLLDTLHLGVTPFTAGETFHWSGPAGFTSTLQNPGINGFTAPDTGTYKVVATTAFGCKDSSTTNVTLVPPPAAVNITGPSVYCQGDMFVPFTVTGLAPGATVLWYPSGTGGTGSTTPSVVSTGTPGMFTVWASQIVGACESPRRSFGVQVKHTPPAPAVSGNMQYCQFIGPFDTLTVSHASGMDTTLWYTVAAGGTPVYAEPVPNLGIVPATGAYQYWVSLRDSGCEGPRTPVSIIIHPKPAAPIVNPPNTYCQFVVSSPVSASVSNAGDVLTWSGAGVIPGMTPVPNTTVAPDTMVFYVKETTIYGCVSDSTPDVIIVKFKPQPPHTHDVSYCQHAAAVSLNNAVDSAYNSRLNWYYHSAPVPAPVPPTDTLPTVFTWWVSQTVPPAPRGCQSDSVPLNVRVVYIPVFHIQASSPWVCQFNSVQLSYAGQGPALSAPQYYWTLPQGAVTVNNTNTGDSSITVRFDTTNGYNKSYTVYLRTSDDSGLCYADTSVSVKVIPLPAMTAYTKPDVCLGDTVQLSLTERSGNAYSYQWYVDAQGLFTSYAVNIVTGNTNSGGPYRISWADTGKHVIKVLSATEEGCKSLPAYDSVDVHGLPDASFRIAPGQPVNSLCIEDSILFNANSVDYGYSYEWGPAAYFNNENKPDIWGRLLNAKDIVTLRVTDPFGCYATQSMEIFPGACCTVVFPNAFTPNYVGSATASDKVFQPIYTGYHKFHLFRIVNRWGQTVFEAANSSDARWDGTYNGVPQDMGTYYYFVKYDCGGSTVEQKGDVTLIR